LLILWANGVLALFLRGAIPTWLHGVPVSAPSDALPLLPRDVRLLGFHGVRLLPPTLLRDEPLLFAPRGELPPSLNGELSPSLNGELLPLLHGELP
jgi:hypothetical protein